MNDSAQQKNVSNGVVSSDLLAVIAFANWYTSAWDYDPYEADEAGIRRMWEKFRASWMPSLNEEHCGDCTKVAAPCTRCHTEAYMKFAEIVARVTSANVADEQRRGKDSA